MSAFSMFITTLDVSSGSWDSNACYIWDERDYVMEYLWFAYVPPVRSDFSLAIRLRIIIKSLSIRVTKIISPLPFTTPAARRRSEQKRQTLYRIGTVYTHILLERTRPSPSTHDLLLYRTSLEKVPFTCLQRCHPLIGHWLDIGRDWWERKTSSD